MLELKDAAIELARLVEAPAHALPIEGVLLRASRFFDRTVLEVGGLLEVEEVVAGQESAAVEELLGLRVVMWESHAFKRRACRACRA